MPYLTDCQEWRLLQEVATPLSYRKSLYQPSSSNWLVSTNRQKQAVDLQLREIFLRRDEELYLTKEDFQDFRDYLSQLCRFLDLAINPAVTQTIGKDRYYPHLSGLARFLQTSDLNEDVRFDLVTGAGDPLFVLSNDESRKVVELARLNNRLIEKALGTGHEEDTKFYPTQRNTNTWMNVKLRDQTSTLLRLLFRRFTCKTTHKLLMDFSSMCPGSCDPSILRLHISTCIGETNNDNWQEMQYHLERYV